MIKVKLNKSEVVAIKEALSKAIEASEEELDDIFDNQRFTLSWSSLVEQTYNIEVRIQAYRRTLEKIELEVLPDESLKRVTQVNNKRQKDATNG